MTDLTVIDIGGEDLAGHIATRLTEHQCGGDILIRSVVSMHETTLKNPDVLVLTEAAADAAAEQKIRLKSSILLLPGDMADLDMDLFEAACLVTYGMSPKNTITLSSINEDYCVLALQRELVTVCGDVLERQEIKVKGGLRPELLLAVAGALLILGMNIAEANP